jgi:MFS transporter, FSR family, fosmidomycin resistance protein
MSQRRAHATLAASCFIHFLHDGCSDLLYPLFPVWAREFSLSFAQVGLLRTGYCGALAFFQVPAGFPAERWGEPRILAFGTLLTAVGFLCLGTAGAFVPLLGFLVIGGLGSGTQHPLSSSPSSSLSPWPTGSSGLYLWTRHQARSTAEVSLTIASE